MWQTPHTRHTQAGARRRNRLGLLACLVAVLLAGVLIGRLTDGEDKADEVYLNSSTPTLTPEATTTSKRSQAQVGRVARETTSPNAAGRARPTTKAKRATGTEIPGEIVGDPTTVHGDPTGESGPSLAAQVVQLTNAERAKLGCGPLRVDRRLTQSAKAHSREMADSGLFSHNSPDGSSPWKRMERAGYTAGAAENIGRGYLTPAEAVRGWMASPAHRRNILQCGYQAIGVGVAAGPGGPYWTQDFGYS